MAKLKDADLVAFTIREIPEKDRESDGCSRCGEYRFLIYEATDEFNENATVWELCTACAMELRNGNLEIRKALLNTDRPGLRTKIETAFTDALEMDGSNADRGMTPSQRILLIRGELITTRNKLCAELESKSA